MHQQQPPQHSELRQSIITCLNCSHTLFSEKPNANVSCLNHGNVIGTISNRQCYLIQLFSHNVNHLGFLQGKQPTTHNSLTVFSKVCKLSLTLISCQDRGQIRPFDQQTFWCFGFSQFISPLN